MKPIFEPYPVRDWRWCPFCDGSGLGTIEEPICAGCDGNGKVTASSVEAYERELANAGDIT